MPTSSLRSTLLCCAAGLPLAAQTRIMTLQGVFPDGQLGSALAPAGDVDRDGFGDIIGSAMFASTNAPVSGWAAVYSGRTGAPLLVFPGRAPGQYFGGGAAGLGDLDGDGHADFAIAATNDETAGDHAGRVWVYSGRTGRVLYDLVAEGPGDIFGHSIAAAGDVDADGVPDFVVGAPENGSPVLHYGAGYVKVFSGRTGAVLHRFAGRAVGYEQGHVVCGVGDLDRDGHDDVLAASVLDGDPSVGIGAARVHSGRTGEVLFTFRGGPRTDHFAVSAAGVGDVDGDGWPDVGVGCVELTNGIPGHASIFSGRTGARIHQVFGQAPMEMFSVSMCGVGDLDRDGHADFAVSAPGAGGGYGQVRVYSGRDASLMRVFDGPDLGSAFAFAMAATDLNNDGYADLVIGSRGAVGNRGRIYVMSGTNATALGSGCADYAPPPTLSATSPRVGGTWSHFVRGAAPSTPTALLIAQVPASPLQFDRACVFYLDPATTLGLGILQTDSSGSAVHQVTLPPAASLVGAQLATQAAMPGRTRPWTLTNGVAATIER
ncbi:MAG: hypothetical protein R3F56_16430 [Planctomycetota bacterium]